MRWSFLAGGLALLLAAFAGAALFTLQNFNHFKPVESRFSGTCEPVTGVPGPEDIEVTPTRDRAFISSLDRRAGKYARGAILAVLVSDPLDSENWRDRTDGKPSRFRPLGVSYFESGDVRRLFVVNEATKSVDLFDVAPNGDLTFVESIAERRLISPNDVAAVGPRSFYVTNDLDADAGSILARFQFLSRAATGTVFYYDGVSMRVAADGLRYANGVALNQRRTRLYVAETSGQALKIFNRDAQNGALTLVAVKPLPAAPDNITVAWDGSIWIGAQPKPLSVPLAQRDPAFRSPSLVIRYFDKEGVASPMSEVFSDAGDLISTASVAAISGGKLLIGALLDSKYLICDLPG